MYRQLVYKCRERENKVKITLVIIGVFILVGNLALHRYLKSVLGLILIIFTFYRKEIYLSKKNVGFIHRGLLFRHIDILPISDITDIVIKNKGENTIICLISDCNFKKIVLDSNKANKIVENLMKENKKIEKSELI